jgi:hypothetical protein
MVPSSLRALRAFALVASALAVVPLAHCSDNSVTPPSSVTIGPGGGALASSDYVFEILIPTGALTTDVNFTITAVDAPGSGSLGPAYTIDPPGQTFLAPVVLSFTQQAISFTPYNDPSDYRIASFDSNAWAPLANPTVDLIAGTIDATTTVTSANAYSVVIPSVGSSCFSADDGCAEDAGGCAPSCDPAVPGKCAAFPGSITSACYSDGGPTIGVECCYPPGEPICVTEIEPNGCENPCQNTPGSTAVSCIPSIGPPVNNTTTGGPPVSTCCYPAGSVIVDGGLIVDGAVGIDAGVDAETDTGTGTDTGAETDTGTDTGTETDTGTATDTGAPLDASDDGG